ncbi:hypothetical protein HPB50_003410 [Hyalomma asiaticum]|uniref:Uncharacterized protein n=1 Tax=Hyalomma asiaticum TaxID=266040 RepID=A0ACB7SR09_HYAAI|nr:hypothetical protein HPB50_003410 [Hyalomma asiaticum]
MAMPSLTTFEWADEIFKDLSWSVANIPNAWSSSKEASRQAKPCSAREGELRSSSLRRAFYQDAPASSGSGRLFQVPGRSLRNGSCQGAVCQGRFGNVAYRCCGRVWRLALDSESCGKSLAATCRSTAPHTVAHPCADDRSTVRRPTVPPLPPFAPTSASCREDVEHKREALFRFYTGTLRVKNAAC